MCVYYTMVSRHCNIKTKRGVYIKFYNFITTCKKKHVPFDTCILYNQTLYSLICPVVDLLLLPVHLLLAFFLILHFGDNIPRQPFRDMSQSFLIFTARQRSIVP